MLTLAVLSLSANAQERTISNKLPIHKGHFLGQEIGGIGVSLLGLNYESVTPLSKYCFMSNKIGASAFVFLSTSVGAVQATTFNFGKRYLFFEVGITQFAGAVQIESYEPYLFQYRVGLLSGVNFLLNFKGNVLGTLRLNVTPSYFYEPKNKYELGLFVGKPVLILILLRLVGNISVRLHFL